MGKLKSWFDSNTSLTHYVAVAIVFLIGAYYNVPAFHQLVVDIYANLPGWGKELATAIVALYLWYRNGQKAVSSPPSSKP